jgi:arsenate reductase-like glutaredoxin family protein
MTCKNAQEFLESIGGLASEVVNAKKLQLGPTEVMALARSLDRVVAARGKKIVTLDMKEDKPDDETLLGVLIGRSGTLRAPAAIVGKTLLVGFNPKVYRDVLKA